MKKLRRGRRGAHLIIVFRGQAEKTLQRTPVEEEVAEQLGVTIEQYHQWLVEIRGINLAPLEQGGPSDGEGTDLLRFIYDENDEWPSQQFERTELERLVARTIERLPEIERTIITLYYHKEMTLRQIARIVSLHETRVSQLKSQAILRMRSVFLFT